MSLNNLINSMQFSLSKALIASFIANERDNQIQLARTAGKEEVYISNNIDFKIYSSLWFALDASECPAVSLWFDGGDFPSGRQYPDSNWHIARLNIDLFAVGIANKGYDNKIAITAEQNADQRLEYLLAQIYQILNSEQSWYLGASEIIKSSNLVSWQRIETPQGENEAEAILGAQLTYEIELNENTEQLTGNELQDIYSSLNIRDEFIDPLIRVSL